MVMPRVALSSAAACAQACAGRMCAHWPLLVSASYMYGAVGGCAGGADASAPRGPRAPTNTTRRRRSRGDRRGNDDRRGVAERPVGAGRVMVVITARAVRGARVTRHALSPLRGGTSRLIS